jgi:hypothetical protein
MADNFQEAPKTTLNDFTSQVKKEGLAVVNRYAVVLPNFEGPDMSRMLLMYCSQAQLPGINNSTTPARTFGEYREMPYERLFEAINLEFYVDRPMKVKTYWDNWTSQIIDPVTRKFNYYKNYTKDITIFVLDKADKQIYGCTLYEAYPKTLNPIQLTAEGKDAMKIGVSLSYRYWRGAQYAKSKLPAEVGDPPTGVRQEPRIIDRIEEDIPQNVVTDGKGNPVTHSGGYVTYGGNNARGRRKFGKRN